MAINLNLDSFRRLANASVSEDLTLQQSGTSVSFKVGQRLGSRTTAYKTDNNAVRQQLMNALLDKYGAVDAIPENVRKVMKLGDFSLKNGRAVTSRRPLTLRRIRAIMTAVDAPEVRARTEAALTRIEEQPSARGLSQEAKLNLAKELAYRPAGAFQERPKLKERFALAALDIVQTLKLQGIQAPSAKGAGAVQALKDYVRQVALVMDAECGKLRNRFEDFGSGDIDNISRALIKLLLGEDKNLDRLVKSLGTDRISAYGAELVDAWTAVDTVSAMPTEQLEANRHESAILNLQASIVSGIAFSFER